MPYMIHPYYTGRDKGPVTRGCDCGAPVVPGRYPDHKQGCALFSGEPLTFETIEDAQSYAVEVLGYGNRTFQIVRDEQPDLEDSDVTDPEELAFLALLGADKAYIAHQHECSDGARIDHYASLVTLGHCPFCGCEERVK